MIRKSGHFATIALAWALLTAAFVAVRADDAANGVRVVVLRNGSVLRGHVTEEGDRTRVDVDHGQIFVPTGEVELVCERLEDAYELRRTATQGAASHLDLAEWCLRQGLLDQAAVELDAVRQLGGDRRLKSLERRLDFARRALTASTTLDRSEPGPRGEEHGMRSSSRDTPQAWADALPAGSLETFARSIQPLLFNTCGAATCHGPRSTGALTLVRAPSQQAYTRRLTLRNLHSVLEHVDRDDPQQSPLLTFAVRRHGGSASAPIEGVGRERLEHLAAWVATVTDDSPASDTGEHEEPSRRPWQSTLVPGMTAAPHPRSRTDEKKPKIAATDAEHEPPDEKRMQEEVQVEQRELMLGADPFDPEIFNRRHFPERFAGGLDALPDEEADDDVVEVDKVPELD